MPGLESSVSSKFVMAVFGLKTACALVMVNALIRLCYGANASGYCPSKTCGVSNDSVEVTYPFVLHDDAVSGGCYTDYPQLEFTCQQQLLYLNFAGNSTDANDMYQVTNIDYYNQTLSLLPANSAATCRPFDASRFGGLNITNTTELLLDCANNTLGSGSCLMFSNSTYPCNSTDSGSSDGSAGDRWVCPMMLKDFRDEVFSSCHLMQNVATLSLGSATVELQFEGNATLSFSEENYGLSKTKKLSIILGVLFGSWGAISIFLLFMVWKSRRHPQFNSSLTSNDFIQLNIKKIKIHKNQATTLFTLKELEKATRNFSNDFKLGSGGFGTVYKGTLDNGLEVAIKKANRVDMKGIEQYINEVSLLSQVNHRNLVGLHGCCLEVEVPMLVYEYVSNGDLFQHIQGERSGVQLTWAKRLQIAIDIAEALRYLHVGASPPIYHRDVKTSNILLDDKFNIKVADFGISRLMKPDATHVSTILQGTVGYLDPEYLQNFQLTDKSDVYSFGIILLELITSLKPVDFERGEDDANLKTMALPFIQEKNIEAIADSRLFNEDASEYENILEEMQRVAELALKCLAERRRNRPSMKEVVFELIAIKSTNSSRNVDETCEMDYEEIEMVPVLDNQSSHFVSSSSGSSHISCINSSTIYEVDHCVDK